MKVSAVFDTETEHKLGKLRRHMSAVRDNIDSIVWIKTAISNDDIQSAAQAWIELDNDAKQALWISTRDGGIFTTSERKAMRTDEFYRAWHND